MDDIYENLDNYCFNQVQTENLELKNKLQEITCQLTNVQSDYDNLKKEFQKLETHYSSLLKTAKAEIQRKTALISTLNTEKDKLIISHVLNGGVRDSYHEKARYERGHTNIEQDKKINNSFNESKKTEESRIKDPRAKESVHEYRTESRKSYFDEECHRTKYSRNRSKDKYYSNKGDIKSRLGEKPHRNIVKHFDDRTCNDKSYDKIEFIRQRRKSAHGQKTRYISSSSDGENNENESKGKYKNRLIREHYRKQSHSPINIERDRLSRNDGRYDKYIEQNRGRSRENNYSRSPMLEHSTKDRNRCYRDSVNNQTEKRSNECVRDLYSPSSFNNKDISPKNLLHDKSKQSNIETRPIKHKLNCDEQIKNKRLRTDEEHIGKHADNEESCKKDKSESLPYNNSEPAPKEDVDSISVKINQHEKRESIKEIKETEEPKTIPDSKEINITDIDLKPRFDDPRLSSNKYVKVLDAKDNSYITTVVGNDVDLKCIKYDDKPQLTFPTPLNCLDLDENHVNEIYMDIDRQVNYMSPESGELLDSESNDVYFSEPSNQCDKSLSSRKDILPNCDKKQLKESTDDASFLPEESNGQACEMTVFGKYKIPKISDKTKRDLIKTSTMGPNNKSSSGTSNNNDKILTHNKGPSQSNNLKEVTKTDFINKMKVLKDAESPKYIKFIAQDLELSDENNDTQELSYISDATLNTTSKESLNCNTEVTSSQKRSNKCQLITSKCSDLFSDSLILPEDLELSDRTNSTALKTKDDACLKDNKILQENIMVDDRSEALTCKDKKERSSKSKEKLKHKERTKEKSKKSSKKDNDKPVKVNSSDSKITVVEPDKHKKDISGDSVAPALVPLPVCDTNTVMNNEQCSRDKAEDIGSPNVSIYEVTSSVPASRLTSPTQSPKSASTGSPRPDVSQPDIRIVIKRRRTLKKKT